MEKKLICLNSASDLPMCLFEKVGLQPLAVQRQASL